MASAHNSFIASSFHFAPLTMPPIIAYRSYSARIYTAFSDGTFRHMAKENKNSFTPNLSTFEQGLYSCRIFILPLHVLVVVIIGLVYRVSHVGSQVACLSTRSTIQGIPVFAPSLQFNRANVILTGGFVVLDYSYHVRLPTPFKNVGRGKHAYGRRIIILHCVIFTP